MRKSGAHSDIPNLTSTCVVDRLEINDVLLREKEECEKEFNEMAIDNLRLEDRVQLLMSENDDYKNQNLKISFVEGRFWFLSYGIG